MNMNVDERVNNLSEYLMNECSRELNSIVWNSKEEFFRKELKRIIKESLKNMEDSGVLQLTVKNNMEMKPCPFCGRKVDLEDHDTLYPDGTGWIYDEKLHCNYYVNARVVPQEQWCYSMHCPACSGGCGAEISGNTKQEAIDAWNRRPE